MATEQENLFKIGLDLDSDLRDVEQGFYTYLKNGTTNSSSSRNKGAAESVKSWQPQTRFWNSFFKVYQTFVLPSGTNTCVATCKDIKNNAIIFFNMNSNGYHAIFRYWIKPLGLDPFIEALSLYSPGIPPLNWGSSLRFSKKFQNPFVIETGKIVSEWFRDPDHPVFGNNVPVQLVFWTDGVVEPMRLNTVDLYQRYESGVPGFPIDKYWLTVGKIQPQIGPRLILEDATSRKSNFLPYKHYQFAVRYKYKDGEYTPLSPFSFVSLLWKGSFFYLNFDRPISGLNNDNYIQLLLTDVTIHETVDKIEWFVREGNGVGSDETNPEWYRFNITESDNPQAEFFGDEETIALSQIESRTNFYTIPRLAAHQEIVEGNQVVYGDITEGYDPIGVEGSVDEIEEELDFTLYPVEKVTGGDLAPLGGLINADVLSVSNMQVGDIIYGRCQLGTTFVGPIITDNLYYSYVLTSGDIANQDTFGNNLASAITAQLGHEVLYNSTTNVLYGVPDPLNNLILKFPPDYNGYAFSQNNPIPAFKEGAKHKFAIVHFDEFMRQGATEEIGELYIPFVVERYPDSGDPEYVPRRYGAEITITSTPPIWAKYYKIVHKCNVKKCAQFTASAFNYVTNALEITVKSYFIFTTGKNPDISNITYSTKGVADFEYTEWVGNRLRFITQEETSTMADTSRKIVSQFIDVQISAVKLDGSGNPVIVISDFGYPVGNIGVNSMFEVYQSGYEPVYFELPMIESDGFIQYGKINNAGTSSRAYDFGTTYETYMGNIYKFWRSMADNWEDPGQYHIESFSISDFWKSDYYSKGRVQPETPNMKQQNIFSMLRWSGKLFENTNVNNTNVFYEGDYRILEQRYGAITGLRVIGYTMKILQWANCSSAFISRRQIQNADGSTQLVVTDSLIGTVNYSEQQYGTKNPESVYVKDRSIYFFDILNQCFVRNDPNGSDDISQKKASRFWQNVADFISEDGGEVITGWDQENKLLYATIVVGGVFYETLAWAPNKGFWDSMHDHCFNTTSIQNYGDCLSGLLSFYNGMPWLVNAGPTYLNILGQAKEMQAAAVCNVTPKKVKVFDYSTLKSNRVAKTEQFVPVSEANPSGQQSEISLAQYVFKEGVYYSSMNRNFLRFGTPIDAAAKRYAMVNGDQLRGHACQTKAIFSGSDIVILYSLITGVIASEKS